MSVNSLSLCLLLLSVHIMTAQGAARLMFNGVEVPEHSLVVRETIGTANADTLMCESDYRPCCTDTENAWFRDFEPNGIVSLITTSGIYQTRDSHGVVRLHYNGGNPDGIFFCQIRVSAYEVQTLYVGVYPSVNDNNGRGANGDGTVTVDCNATAAFTLISGPEVEEPDFILSCTSIGGPVRAFSCTSPGGGNIAGVTSLRYPVTGSVRDQGIYDHSVTVTGNYPGDYTCRVTVYRYYGTAPEPEILIYPETPGVAQTITVPAAEPPTGLSATQVGNTISVRWTPPSSTPYGYRIYYQAEGDQGSPPSVVVTGGSTTTQNLTIPESGISYTISIQTLSSTILPSVATTVLTGLSLKLTTSGSTAAGSTDYSATCEVTVYLLIGTPSITWKNPDGTIISTSSDFTVGSVTRSDPTYSCELMFNSLKTSQAGVYTCSATLDSKTVKSTTPVNVIIPPSSAAVTANPDLYRSFDNGDTVTLTCTITLDPAVDSVVAVMVSWTGPDGKMLSTGDRVTVSDVTGSEPYQSTLTLSSLITSNTGVYTCTASAGPDISTPHIVASENVTVSHTINVVDYTISVSARIGRPVLGQTYSLTCTVEGLSGSPIIQWFGPDGSEVTIGVSTTTLTSILTFTDLAISDAGEYICRSTFAGIVREVVDKIMLQIVPDITLVHDGGSGAIYAGSPLTLSCYIGLSSDVSGIINNLTVTSLWSGQSGGQVVGDSRVTVQPAKRISGTLVFVSTVEFNTLRTSDADTFTCTATVTPSGSLSLSQGQDSKATPVTVVIPPPSVAVVANPDRTLYEGESVTLTCDITVDPAVDSVAAVIVTWAGPVGEITPGVTDVTGSGPYQSTLTLSVEKADAGVYSCTANVDPDASSTFVLASTPGTSEYTLTIEDYTIDITAPPDPTASHDYTLTCKVDVGEGIPTLQWTGPGVTTGEAIGNNQVQSGTIFTLDLSFSPLLTSLGGTYMCQSTVGSGAVARTASTTVNVQIAIDSVEITSAPDRTLYTEETVTLTCEITLSPSVNTAVDVSVIWSGTQGEMLSTDGRVTVSHGTGSSPYHSSLILIALEEADTGMYTCTASAGPVNSAFVTASDGSSSTLQVTVEQYNVTITTPPNATAGQTYTLTCEVDVGEGTPTFQWTGPGVTTGEASEGTEMQAGTTFTHTLFFSPILTSHGGVYTCQSTVGSDTTAMSTVTVHVQIAIESVEITSAPDRTLYTEESVILTCEITLSPSVNTAVDVSVTWLGTQGEMLSTDGRVTVSDVTGSAPYKSTLTLSSLITSDTGSYTCTASVGPSSPQVVASGDVTDAHTLTVEEYTISNITTMGVPATSETYSLTCTVVGVSGSPTIQWFGPAGSEISAGVSTSAPLTSTLAFTDLSLSDAGKYTCRSTLTGVVREALEVVLVQNEANFQLQLGPVTLCTTWTTERTNDIKAAIFKSISMVISAGCNCSFPEAAFQSGLFSCWNSPSEVTYRNSIISTDNTSKLVGYIEDWVNSEQPFMQLGDFRLKVYQDCPVRISSMNDPECLGTDPAVGEPSVITSSDPVVIGCLNRCLLRHRQEALCPSP